MAKKRTVLKIGTKSVGLGESRDIKLPVSETYTGSSVNLYVKVIRAKVDGPVVFLTGAVHGDEINGTGIIREIMLSKISLLKGSLICVPVTNIFGFENHSRYLPDRRDLNRNFPGNANGSMAQRLANTVYKEVICNSDYGIDLHTATARRTNFPHIRADMTQKEVAKIANAFGCEIVVTSTGPDASLRKSSADEGCSTILYEVGESLKFEPGAIQLGVRGIRNILKNLGMLEGDVIKPLYQTVSKKTQWVRSTTGGIVHFHAKPGDVIEKGDKIATCQKLFNDEEDVVVAPIAGVIIGMTTLPAVKPGEPICHIAITEKPLEEIKAIVSKLQKTLHKKVQDEIATSFRITNPKK